jgi:hypothetical protein
LLLGRSFVDSGPASKLRQALWTRERSARERIGIRGSAFLSDGSDAVKDAIAWDGCHTFVVQPAKGMLGLTASFYGHLVGSVAITDEPERWAGRVPDDGMIWVVAPGFRQVFGPVDIPAFAGERVVPKSSPMLASLRDLLESAPALPPFHIPGQPD